MANLYVRSIQYTPYYILHTPYHTTHSAYIYESIRQTIAEIAAQEIAGQGQHNQPNQHEQEPLPELIQPLPADELGIFDEINNHYLDENANRTANNTVARDPEVSVATAADAELTLYKQEPSIRLKNDDGTFNCLLTWWKFNERIYKLLSVLSSRVLCIPAISAPSERVFFIAGLTIAKDHARLASDTANELIFLYDALPAIHKFFETERERA